jgi:glutamate/tyrosine decarboxylase-like PLP-dependent enzyme
VHAAFQKAAHYFGLALDLVPVDPATGIVDPNALISRFGDDVALVVVSAPSYPHAALDPISEVAAAALARGIDCHVDACIGGWVLPFLDGVPPWDFTVDGVTSISADLHKFGYAPKGASVLMQRGRDRQRTQYFATTRWPGYPVVNPTMLGSKSAASLAASWAIIHALGMGGLRELSASCARSTTSLIALIDSIEGLRVVGTPVGPLLAVTTDESVEPQSRVDPHHWADRAKALGWLLQLQPGFTQSDGTRLPSTTHLTITPVTEGVLAELSAALVSAADDVRGIPAITAADVLGALPDLGGAPALDSDTAFGVLAAMGLTSGGGLPAQMAPVLALIEALPAPLTERLLTELLARLIEPE